MPFYTIYTPPEDSPGAGLADTLSRAEVLKDGFSFPAFILTGLWLLSKRLWLIFGLFALFYGALVLLQARFGLSAPALAFAQLGLALFLGFEGHSLRGQKLLGSGWRLAGVVEARNQDEAERRFFERALDGMPLVASRVGTAPARPQVPISQVNPRPPTPEVIGMFPGSAVR